MKCTSYIRTKISLNALSQKKKKNIYIYILNGFLKNKIKSIISLPSPFAVFFFINTKGYQI